MWKLLKRAARLLWRRRDDVEKAARQLEQAVRDSDRPKPAVRSPDKGARK